MSTDQSIDLMLSNMPNLCQLGLNGLKLRGNQIGNICGPLENLKSLILVKLDNLSIHRLQNLLSVCPNLKSLAVVNSALMGNWIVEKCKPLKKLES